MTFLARTITTDFNESRPKSSHFFFEISLSSKLGKKTANRGKKALCNTEGNYRSSSACSNRMLLGCFYALGPEALEPKKSPLEPPLGTREFCSIIPFRTKTIIFGKVKFEKKTSISTLNLKKVWRSNAIITVQLLLQCLLNTNNKSFLFFPIQLVLRN